MTPRQYSEQNNVSIYVARKIFIKNGWPLPGRGGQNALIKINPFEQNSEKQQYFLGLLASDGYIGKKVIKLKLKDKELVEEYAKFLGHDIQVKEEKSPTGIMYRVNFANRLTIEYLNNLGLVEKKSLILNYKGELTNHFIRGVFDGDGCVSKNREVKITSGSILFINQLYELFFSLNFDFAVHKKGNCFDIKIKAKSRDAFFEFLYKDATVYLERKYKAYCGLIGRPIL